MTTNRPNLSNGAPFGWHAVEKGGSTLRRFLTGFCHGDISGQQAKSNAANMPPAQSVATIPLTLRRRLRQQIIEPER